MIWFRCPHPARYLDAVDAAAAHAPAAVHQEDKLAGGFAEILLGRPQVRAEVQHDDRVVGDVLVQALPDDFCLQGRRRGKAAGAASCGPAPPGGGSQRAYGWRRSFWPC